MGENRKFKEVGSMVAGNFGELWNFDALQAKNVWKQCRTEAEEFSSQKALKSFAALSSASRGTEIVLRRAENFENHSQMCRLAVERVD